MANTCNNVVYADFRRPRTPTVKDAPWPVVQAIESEAHALDVAMAAAGLKLANVADHIGKSIGYVSRMRAGKRAIPDRLVTKLCEATGSNLLRQYRDLQRTQNGECRNGYLVELMRRAA